MINPLSGFLLSHPRGALHSVGLATLLAVRRHDAPPIRRDVGFEPLKGLTGR
jgi:hypothetical protein